MRDLLGGHCRELGGSSKSDVWEVRHVGMTVSCCRSRGLPLLVDNAAVVLSLAASGSEVSSAHGHWSAAVGGAEISAPTY